MWTVVEFNHTEDGLTQTIRTLRKGEDRDLHTILVHIVRRCPALRSVHTTQNPRLEAHTFLRITRENLDSLSASSRAVKISLQLAIQVCTTSRGDGLDRQLDPHAGGLRIGERGEQVAGILLQVLVRTQVRSKGWGGSQAGALWGLLRAFGDLARRDWSSLRGDWPEEVVWRQGPAHCSRVVSVSPRCLPRQEHSHLRRCYTPV